MRETIFLLFLLVVLVSNKGLCELSCQRSTQHFSGCRLLLFLKGIVFDSEFLVWFPFFIYKKVAF